jgi:cobalt/nickel transport system permease protein
VRGALDGFVVPGPSPLHRLRPHTKIVATLVVVAAIVSTPRHAVWAFGLHAVLLVALARTGRVPLPLLARRLTIEVPFVGFALLLPFVALGERVEVLGVHLAVEGLWGAWNVLAKATLGLATTVLLVSTTAPADLLRGLDRLRVPAVFTSIAGFMLRYLEVIGGELRRMQVARVSRAHDPRWMWQARAVASTAGTLFVRSFERGERVHLAMVSRGFDGTLRRQPSSPATSGEWVSVAGVVALAVAVCIAARTVP